LEGSLAKEIKSFDAFSLVFEGASSHYGRRTFLTDIANMDTAIHILKTLAGQRSISTTVAFLYNSPSQLKAGAELA
jgi:integrase/recombinase XerD